MKFDLPKEVKIVAELLKERGFKAYLVGGCIRDLIMHKTPKDWDVATDALPGEIIGIFSNEILGESIPRGTDKANRDLETAVTGTVYENEFGTVGVKTNSEDPTLKIIEVTTFRLDGKYSDARHPDEVVFAKTIEEDLSRRDFTVNAIAFQVKSEKSKIKSEEILVDPYGGLDDLKKKIIRAVGNAEERFDEDALRLMRAVRFSAQLGFEIEKKTAEAAKDKSALLQKIAKERIRDELTKLIMTGNASSGIVVLEDLGLLQYVLPELRDGIGVGQNKHHIYTVYEHNIRALQYAASKNYSLEVRLAALLHDVGKPKTKRGEGPDSTFYGHQVVGAKMAKAMLTRLNFSKKVIDQVNLLVYEHMFMYDPDVVTPAGVRRLLKRVGTENIDDLLKVREGDRIGSGVPKARTYSMRHLEAMIEKEKTAPVSPKMMKINGNDLMEGLKISPSPRLGKIISILLEEILEKPDMNTKEKLLDRSRELNTLQESELDAMQAKAKETASKAQERIDEEIKDKYFVK